MQTTILLLLFSTTAVQAEVVIYGGTPGGIAAALSAARMGREVTLVEYHDHIGGMTTSGLGKSDVENRAMIGGLFREFVARVHYITRPYEIPYRIMLPEKIDGLIVPVAASTTHVAFSSIRMEPTWMALGQAAGVAAHLAIQDEIEPRQVPAVELQTVLRKQNAVIEIPGRSSSTP